MISGDRKIHLKKDWSFNVILARMSFTRISAHYNVYCFSVPGLVFLFFSCHRFKIIINAYYARTQVELIRGRGWGMLYTPVASTRILPYVLWPAVVQWTRVRLNCQNGERGTSDLEQRRVRRTSAGFCMHSSNRWRRRVLNRSRTDINKYL